MRIKQLLYVTGALCGLFLGGCASDTPSDIADGKGRIVLRVGVDGSVADVVPATRASQASKVPDAAELNLKLVKVDGSYIGSWGSVGEFPVDQQFTIGAYTLEAYYGAMDYEGFDAPYYHGVADLNVVEGSANEVSVTASLANTMVSIDYTDAFRRFFSQYSAQVHSAGGDYISFESQEERPAYLRPGNVTLDVSITKQNGLSASLQAAEFEALPRHHYHITLDVNEGQTGEGMLKILFDDSVVTEDVDIDISDAVLLLPGPAAASKGYVHDQAVDAVEGETPSQTLATLNAPGGLRSVTLTTRSPELLQRGFPAELDLMRATEAQQALLSSFGLEAKGLYTKPDKMAVVDFTEVFRHIGTAGEHSFTLVAVDRYGKTHDPLTLKISTRLVNLSFVSLPDIRIDATQATATVAYDGKDFGDNVHLELQTSAGDWYRPQVVGTVPSGDGYAVTFKVPEGCADLPVRLVYGSKAKASGILKKTGVLLSADDVDMWATHATFSVRKNDAVSLSDLAFYVSADDSGYSTVNDVTVNADGTVTLGGLTPGAKMYVKSSDTGALAGAYRSCTIFTEAAAQPENGNMDSWSKDSGWSKAALGYNNTIYNYFPWQSASDNAYWATRNALTTNKEFGYTSMWYNYYAGTYNVAGVNGSNCAEICTVGWAKTSANTFVSGGGKCGTKSAGYLFMGSYAYDKATDTETFEYGRPFTSRPAALTFMYKFAGVGSESFKAYVVVENRDGGKVTELGRAELVSSQNQGSFTTATLPIKYTNRKMKATHAYVVFVSSTASSPGVNAVQGLKNAFQGYTDARYIGNVLDVDNIIFTY